ncbi:hypothetical protein [Brevibacterium ammoniilyticum]
MTVNPPCGIVLSPTGIFAIGTVVAFFAWKRNRRRDAERRTATGTQTQA